MTAEGWRRGASCFLAAMLPQGFISSFVPLQKSPALPKGKGREGPTNVPGEEQNSTVPSNHSRKVRDKESVTGESCSACHGILEIPQTRRSRWVNSSL